MRHRILVTILMAVLAASTVSCDKYALKSEVDELENRVSKLETLCQQMNSNISALQTIVQALEGQDYITSVTPVESEGKTIGYTISFFKNGDITIYNGQDGKDGADGKDGTDGKDGKDGSTPVISIKQGEDGNYYWTLNGEWLLDEQGNRIRANGKDGANGTDGADGTDGTDGANGTEGVTPKLKIEDGFWYVSYDNGESWNRLGAATSGNGDPLFTNVTYDDYFLHLTLNDGTELAVPMKSKTELVLSIENGEAVIAAGETIAIDYEIRNAGENARISASSDGYYAVQLKRTDAVSGTIFVKAPATYVDGFINIILDDGCGYTSLHIINFCERHISFAEGLEFNTAAEGGSVDIPILVNFDFSAVVDAEDADWLTIVTTKAEDRNETIRVNVAANEGAARTGHIRIFGSNSKEALQVISISQAAQGSEPVKAGSVILSFPDENKNNNKVSAYDKSWIAKSGDYSFEMFAFNNYNWNGWSYIKCGRKNNPSTATVKTIEPIAAIIEKVVLTVDKITDADKINFITLSVYSDSACEEPIVENIEADKKEAGEITMAVPSDKVGAGLYYVITIDCAPAAGNGIVQISKISYIAAE